MTDSYARAAKRRPSFLPSIIPTSGACKIYNLRKRRASKANWRPQKKKAAQVNSEHKGQRHEVVVLIRGPDPSLLRGE